MPNPITFIKDDHRNVESLFEEYESCAQEELEEKQDIAIQIGNALTVHAGMEEEILYPKLREVFEGDDAKLLEEAYAEHTVAKQLLEEIKLLVPEDPQFDAKITVLKENVLHHVKEEEEKILSRMEDLVSEDDMTVLGEELEAYKIENEE